MISHAEIEKLMNGHFRDCLRSLDRLSLDSENNKSMLDLPGKYFSYDDIAQTVYRGDNSPKSPDMIMFSRDGVVFVEFKNGKIHHRDREKIKLKALEGGFIVFYKTLCWCLAKNNQDNTNISLGAPLTFEETARLKKSYILVYNDQKDPRIRIHNHTASKSTRFGLSIYEGTFFYKVRTLSPGNFQKMLDNGGID